jgi:ATP-dependent RNA helicase DDX31/DBP7
MQTERLYLELLEKYKLNIEEIKIEEVLFYIMTIFKSKKKKDPIEASTVMQTIFEQTVESDDELKGLAIKAYQSYTKSYSTHSKDTKYIFNIKSLHLGIK